MADISKAKLPPALSSRCRVQFHYADVLCPAIFIDPFGHLVDNGGGHVQMSIGGGSWIECCSGYGVSINMSNAWMESRPCHYFSYAGF